MHKDTNYFLSLYRQWTEKDNQKVKIILISPLFKPIVTDSVL